MLFCFIAKGMLPHFLRRQAIIYQMAMGKTATDVNTNKRNNEVIFLLLSLSHSPILNFPSSKIEVWQQECNSSF